MNLFSIDIAVFKALVEALAIGTLVGIERYKDRNPDEKRSAGVRTFTILALLGTICGLLGEAMFTLITFAVLAAFLWLGYHRHSAQSIGLTTESAALLVFWLGYLLHAYEMLAISIGIILAIVLASKRALHEFVREKISETEFYDTLKFLAVVFVVFPLLPDRGMGPYGFFNPTHIWLLVVLVSTISYSGYILMRWLGSNRGLKISGLVGGIVSTTAVTMSLAERTRQNPATSHICGMVGVMANAVQFPRLLLLIWVVNPQLGKTLMLPLLSMGLAGLLGAWLLTRIRKVANTDLKIEVTLQNPYSLAPALKFGSLFVGIFLLVKVATAWLGEQGIYLASALAGAGDASAISFSIAQSASKGSLSFPTASLAILIAVTMNALVKEVLVLVNGTRALAFWLGGGFVTMLGTGFVLTYLIQSSW